MAARKRALVDPKQLENAVKQVATIAKNEHVQVALAGGFAMQLYGSDRFTQDIDVVISSQESPLQGLPETGSLAFGGGQSEAPNGVEVDVIRRDDDYAALYDAALENAEHVEGIPMPVISPEYLLAMKMQASRDKDHLDMTFLIAEKVADVAKTRKIVKKYLGPYAAEELDAFVSEVEWKHSQASKRTTRKSR